jgi:Transposase DDE domain
MQYKRGATRMGYHAHYVVDGGKARVILQTLVTPADVTENQTMLDLLFRTRFRWRARVRRVTGDARRRQVRHQGDRSCRGEGGHPRLLLFGRLRGS